MRLRDGYYRLMTYVFFTMKLINAAEWSSIAGLTSENAKDNIIVWSGLKDTFYDAGVYKNAHISMIYGGIEYFNEHFKLQAGHIYHSFFNEFLLSPGGYFPESVSTPDKRPAGIGVYFQKEWFFLAAGYYLHFPDLNPHTIQIKDQSRILNTGVILRQDKWELLGATGVCISQPPPDIKNLAGNFMESVNPYLSLSLKLNNFLEINGLYSYFYGWTFHSILSLRKVYFRLDLFSAKNENPFSALFYNAQKHFYISFNSDFLNFKFYDNKNVITARSSFFIQNVGLLNYINGKNNLSGFIYHSSREQLEPYLGIYATPDLKVYMGSIGFNYGDLWMFCFVHSVNTSSQFYPYDPIIIPDRFYYDNAQLDSYTTYNHSYTGLQFFWSQKNIFYYMSILQNFEDPVLNNLIVIIRFMYTKQF